MLRLIVFGGELAGFGELYMVLFKRLKEEFSKKRPIKKEKVNAPDTTTYPTERNLAYIKRSNAIAATDWL